MHYALYRASKELTIQLDKYGIEIRAEQGIIITPSKVIRVALADNQATCVRLITKAIDEVKQAREKKRLENQASLF